MRFWRRDRRVWGLLRGLLRLLEVGEHYRRGGGFGCSLIVIFGQV